MLVRYEHGSKAMPQTTVPQRHSTYGCENVILKFFEHY